LARAVRNALCEHVLSTELEQRLVRADEMASGLELELIPFKALVMLVRQPERLVPLSRLVRAAAQEAEAEAGI